MRDERGCFDAGRSSRPPPSHSNEGTGRAPAGGQDDICAKICPYAVSNNISPRNLTAYPCVSGVRGHQSRDMHVGELSNRELKKCLHTLSPIQPKWVSVDIFDVNIQQTICERVEPGSTDHNVKLLLFLGRLDTTLSHFHHGRLIDINEMDVFMSNASK
jgi:hypothetical protein